MFDWDAMMRTAAKGHGFVGRGRGDEDAYYSAFANDPEDRKPVEPARLRFTLVLDVLLRRHVS